VAIKTARHGRPRIRHRSKYRVRSANLHRGAHSSRHNTITLSWEDWRAVIDMLREKELPSMREHADSIEPLLDRHAPDEPMVTIGHDSLTDDVILWFCNWARWQLGIPLPPD
jgi:hypothetical protein